MISFKQCAAVSSVLFLAACAEPGDAKSPSQGAAGTFTYAPALNVPSQETMHRVEEVSIPGTPMRDTQTWTLAFDVVTTQEANLFKRSMKVAGLQLNINGIDSLKGDEIKASGATIEVLTDKTSNVVDVRGTDQLSAAIVALGTPEAQPGLKAIFSPTRLKALAVMRSIEQHADFVGHPAAVGSQWMSGDAASGGTKQIRVAAAAPCGKDQCVQVVRTYEVDKNALFAEVADRVAAYVQSQGGDPKAVKLAGVDAKFEDSILINPATMDYHGVRFDETATIRVAGPNGELPVSFKLQRDSVYKY